MSSLQAKTVHLVTVVILALLTFQLHASPRVVDYDDPWENMNRAIFGFNHAIDSYTLKPIAKGYDYVTPKPVQGMVGNFFDNLGEIRNTANAMLQLRGGDTVVSLSRLIINSTIGMLGLVDVATPLGLEQRYSDFGLTFAHWGASSGPYVVLPLLGSSTVRAGIGKFPDSYANPLTYYDPQRDRWIARGIGLVDIRAKLLGAEELVVGDRYTFIRDSYLQRREFLITGEQPEDDF